MAVTNREKTNAAVFALKHIIFNSYLYLNGFVPSKFILFFRKKGAFVIFVFSLFFHAPVFVLFYVSAPPLIPIFLFIRLTRREKKMYNNCI